jgi:hypothetical protein
VQAANPTFIDRFEGALGQVGGSAAQFLEFPPETSTNPNVDGDRPVDSSSDKGTLLRHIPAESMREACHFAERGYLFGDRS